MIARSLKAKDADRASEVLINAFKSFLGDKVNGSLKKHFIPKTLIKEANVKNKFFVSKIFVAETNGKVIGAMKVSAGINGLGTFDYVGVDPECHTKGIGKFLMKKAEYFWAKHNQRKISTCVSAHNKKAIMYYLKHDFVPEGYRRDHFFEGVDEIILGRFLRKKNRK